MKILLDVGAHAGQTARAALDPSYCFDKIVCFEPAPSCWPELDGINDPRVEVCRFGLWKETCRRPLFRAGFLGASIFGDMENLARSSAGTTEIELRKATDWFSEHVSASDAVFVKLNCEGAECDIIEDLLDSGEFRKAYNVMIDFDVRFVPSLRQRELDVRRRLRALDYFNVAFADDVMHGTTHEDRIHHWLTTVGAHENLSRPALQKKYRSTLERLSKQTGTRARLKVAARRQVDRLPLPLQESIRKAWRAITSR